ncbi:tetratricopeptide repeat protein [Adhaeribacter terreus]|uniref:Tetratricopeptide repeat protein n=1 Tax=Adhaeribacter terreus TaxID=529703 RepID=A0ABW0E892_9BACT
MKRLFCLFSLAFFAFAAHAQNDSIRNTAREQQIVDSIMRVIEIDSVVVLPQPKDIRGMLLLDKDIQNELGGAVDNLYNFKYALAEKQFKSLRRRYPKHPMPYFLMGLSQWWKIVPTNIRTKQYDAAFYAYMDTTITHAEAMFDANEKNFEAAFFLAAAYGFKARLHAERSDWSKATFASKNSLEYLQKSRVGNDLSPEFLFGEGLYNYYAVWISNNYPLLKPVLLFFPDGDKKLGLQQLNTVAANGFYTGTEAKFFLMKIYANEENNPAAAMPISRYLAYTYPDNAYFQRFYARLAFLEGNFMESERVSLDILDKLNRHMPGYEEIGGRYASYFLAYISQNKYKDLNRAKGYYEQCVNFSKQTNEEKSGYALYALLNLAKIAEQQQDLKLAKKHYERLKDIADKKSEPHKAAKSWLKKHRKV